MPDLRKIVFFQWHFRQFGFQFRQVEGWTSFVNIRHLEAQKPSLISERVYCHLLPRNRYYSSSAWNSVEQTSVLCKVLVAMCCKSVGITSAIERMTLTQWKTKKPLQIPMTDRLKAHLASVGKRGLTIVTDSQNRPGNYQSMAEETRKAKARKLHLSSITVLEIIRTLSSINPDVMSKWLKPLRVTQVLKC